MKILSKVTVLCAIFWFTNSLTILSQSNEDIDIKPFGIGLHMEQFKIGDIGMMSNYSANKIIFIINTTDNFRIEPEIGFIIGKNKTSKIDYTGLNLGFGFSKINLLNKFVWQYGIRLDYNYVDEDRAKINIIKFGPVIGGEYFFGDHISIGGEISVKYNSFKINYENSGYIEYEEDTESYYITTETGLLLRFYF